MSVISNRSSDALSGVSSASFELFDPRGPMLVVAHLDNRVTQAIAQRRIFDPQMFRSYVCGATCYSLLIGGGIALCVVANNTEFEFLTLFGMILLTSPLVANIHFSAKLPPGEENVMIQHGCVTLSKKNWKTLIHTLSALALIIIGIVLTTLGATQNKPFTLFSGCLVFSLLCVSLCCQGRSHSPDASNMIN